MNPHELPTHDVDPRVGERIRRRARAALAEERRLLDRPLLARASRAWNGALEPALAAGVVGIYLAWLARTVLPLM